MSIIKDENFYKLLEEKIDEAYERLYKEKFTQAYMITYAECGDGDKAEAVAEEEAVSFAEHMIKVMEKEIEEDLEEMLKEENTSLQDR